MIVTTDTLNVNDIIYCALQEADLLALKNLIYTKKPHCICVGGESREAIMVQADLKEIVSNLVDEEQFPTISVEILDNELAKVYANSIKGTVSFMYSVLIVNLVYMK
jgi:transcription elongation factor SPT6